jgi:hypothetical protein
MKETPTLHQLGALVSRQIRPQDMPPEAWPEVIGAAFQHGLAPMLLWVTKQDAPDIVTEPLWSPVIATTHSMAIRYVTLDAARKQVSLALEEAQIPALWLKGIALAHTVYPQPVLRPMSDLDVLVPYEQRENALRIVEGLGYHFYEMTGQLVGPEKILHLNLTHHYHLKGGINDSVVLELHFRLLGTNNKLLPLDKLLWFWSQTAVLQNSSQFTIPQAEAHLLYLCAHAILQHGEEDTLLRQYFDLHQLITHTTMNWEKVIAQAGMLGWGYAVERALTIVVRYFSTPIPEAVFAELQRSHPKHDAAAVRAERIRGRGSRWELTLLRLQELSFADRMEMVFRFLLPPKAYMRRRYGLRPNQLVWPLYLYRWFDQGQDMMWAIGARIARAVKRWK